ncbi:MAG: hypothetical protein H0V05_07515 [Euzebyaceae bacterium]|jgi:hypothetical protein|nr:hypothetical protein [Euzebyaceae bacterium]
MEIPSAIDRIIELLDSSKLETVNTSMRIPNALIGEAATLAVDELGAAASTTALTTAALRATLEALVMQAALEHHYEQHPATRRPSLADLAIAAAELDGHPLAGEPERLRRAAAEIVQRHPHADDDDVLLWAEAQSFASA